MFPLHIKKRASSSPFFCVVLILGLAGFVVSGFGCGERSSSSVTLRLSLVLSNRSDWYRGAKRFADLVEERTEGRYHILIYPHAQLAGGSQRTELEMVQTGVIDCSLESTVLLSLLDSRMSVLCMPWLFTDYASADRVLEGPLGEELLGLLPPKGLVGLAYGANGFRQITNSRHPVRQPSDLNAMKIRVPAMSLYLDTFTTLGADPSSMSFSEVFTALAQGTFDGQENPISVIFSSRLYEVQRFLDRWNYSYDPIVLCVNRERWESFSAGDQAIIAACAREAMRWERDTIAREEDALLDSLVAHGMLVTTFNESTRTVFLDRVSGVYNRYRDKVGGQFLDRFLTIARKVEERP